MVSLKRLGQRWFGTHCGRAQAEPEKIHSEEYDVCDDYSGTELQH